MGKYLEDILVDGAVCTAAALKKGGSANNELQRDYCGVWPIKCLQGLKRYKSNCQFSKKLTFDKIVDYPSQDLLGQKPQLSQKTKKKLRS